MTTWWRRRMNTTESLLLIESSWNKHEAGGILSLSMYIHNEDNHGWWILLDVCLSDISVCVCYSRLRIASCSWFLIPPFRGLDFLFSCACITNAYIRRCPKPLHPLLHHPLLITTTAWQHALRWRVALPAKSTRFQPTCPPFQNDRCHY